MVTNPCFVDGWRSRFESDGDRGPLVPASNYKLTFQRSTDKPKGVGTTFTAQGRD